MVAAAPVKAFPVQVPMPLHAKGAAKAAAGASGSSGATRGADGSGSGFAPGAVFSAEFGKLFRERAEAAPLSTRNATAAAAPQAASRAGAPGPESEWTSGAADRAQSTSPAKLPDSALLLDQLRGELRNVAAEEVANDGPQASATEISVPASTPGKAEPASPGSESSLDPRHKLKDKKDSPQKALTTTPVPAASTAAVSATMAAMAPAPPAAPPRSPQSAAAAGSDKTQPPAAAIPQGSAGGRLTPGLSATLQEFSVELAPHSAHGESANQIQVPVSFGVARSSGPQPPAAAGDRGEASAAVPVAHAGHSVTESKPIEAKIIEAKIIEPKFAALSAKPVAAAMAAWHPEAPAWTPSGATQPSPASSAATVSAAAGPSAIYDRIDQAAAPVVLHSGAQHVSVGIHDSNLGWVEIQTQNTAGHVDTMLVTSSGQSHDSLAAQLPAMAQFLEQRDVRIGTLAVQQQARGGGGGMASGTGYSGSGGTGAHHSGSERNTRRAGGMEVLPRAVSRAASGTNSDGEGPLYRPISYISVRA